MQIFELIYDYLRFIGYSANQSIQKSPFNARNVITSLIFVMNIVCNVGFAISGFEDLKELTDSLYITYTIVCSLLVSVHSIWNMWQLFEFFKIFEEIVNQSKQKMIFIKISTFLTIFLQSTQEGKTQYRKPFMQSPVKKFKNRCEF